FHERCPIIRKSNDRKFCYQQVNRPGGRKWKSTFFDDFCFALGRMLHGNNHTLGAGYEIHRSAHPRDHLARDHPVRELSFRIDLKRTEYRDVDVTAADQTERDRAVKSTCPG